MKCKVCSREAQSQSEYCELHEKAYQNIRQKFEVWKKSLRRRMERIPKGDSQKPIHWNVGERGGGKPTFQRSLNPSFKKEHLNRL